MHINLERFFEHFAWILVDIDLYVKTRAGQEYGNRPKPPYPFGPLVIGSDEPVYRLDGLKKNEFIWVKPVGLDLNIVAQRNPKPTG